MKNVMDFLGALKEHNTRDWMQENKKQYQETKAAFEAFVGDLINGIAKFDNSVEGLTAKDCMFRLNRDIRFSKDKSPYKTHYGAAIMEGGRKSPQPTYYIHVEPGKSFVAGGVYKPEAENIKKIRQEIDYNPAELKKIVEDAAFKKTFGEMTGESLKTAPKGYPKDHPNIELLRMKSFLITRDLQDKEVLNAKFKENVLQLFQQMSPFNQYFAVAMS